MSTKKYTEVISDKGWSRIDKYRAETQQEKSKRFGMLMIAPAIFFLLAFVVLPVSYVAWLSFHDIGLLEISGSFNGLSNYEAILASEAFWGALGRGTIYAVASVAFQLVVGLAIALLLNKKFKGASLARTFTIVPYLIPGIAVVLMWEWILHPSYGLLNTFLINFGFIDEGIRFFDSTTLAMPMVILAGSWKYISFIALVLLSRLQSIDDSLYEQAKVSGAGRWRMFRTVTLPNLQAAILVVVLLRLVWMFNKFDLIYLFTFGGPLNATETLPLYAFETTFSNLNLGEGAAISMVMFTILSVFAIIYFAVFKPSQEIAAQES